MPSYKKNWNIRPKNTKTSRCLKQSHTSTDQQLYQQLSIPIQHWQRASTKSIKNFFEHLEKVITSSNISLELAKAAKENVLTQKYTWAQHKYLSKLHQQFLSNKEPRYPPNPSNKATTTNIQPRPQQIIDNPQRKWNHTNQEKEKGKRTLDQKIQKEPPPISQTTLTTQQQEIHKSRTRFTQ